MPYETRARASERKATGPDRNVSWAHACACQIKMRHGCPRAHRPSHARQIERRQGQIKMSHTCVRQIEMRQGRPRAHRPSHARQIEMRQGMRVRVRSKCLMRVCARQIEMRQGHPATDRARASDRKATGPDQNVSYVCTSDRNATGPPGLHAGGSDLDFTTPQR